MFHLRSAARDYEGPLGLLHGFAFHKAKALDQMILGTGLSRRSVSIR
jgi:hypothetical protein